MADMISCINVLEALSVNNNNNNKVKQSLYRPITGPEGSRRLRPQDFEAIST